MATYVRRGKLQELDQQERIGDGPADWPLVHSTFEMPMGSAWQTNWIATFILLVVIIILAALAFGFALAGFLKTTHMQKDITDLEKVCLRPDCIGIHKLPISLKGGHCYVLKKNFTLGGGDGIRIVGQTDIDLCYANHNIEATVALVPLLIINSTAIRVHNAYHHSPFQQGSGSSSGIRVQTNALTTSTAIFLYSPVLVNFTVGVRARNADVTVINPYITGLVVEFGPTIVGVQGQAMLNLAVHGGYISIPALAPEVAFSFGINVIGASTNVVVDGTTVYHCEVCVIVQSAVNARLSRIRATADPSGSSPSAIQIGSNNAVRNVIIEDVHADCTSGFPGTDCVLLWNAQSVLVDGLTVIGSSPFFEELSYQGGLVSIASQSLSEPPNFHWVAESYDLRHITIRVLDDVSIGLNINAGVIADKRNMTVSVRDSTIKGGLVGVLFSGEARNAMLQSVTVADAPYCFAATEGTDGVTMKDCDAFRCCLGYWATPLSSAVGVYNSRATRCGTSYLNQGTDCELSTGAGSEGNNRLLAETGDECFLPPLPFPISVDSASANSTVAQWFFALRMDLSGDEEETVS